MEFKGTPSPWRLRQGKRKAMISGRSWTNLAKVITHTITIGESEDYQEKEEGKANALLISKAPEMLEMLVKLKNHHGLSPNNREEIKQLIKEATEIK